MKSLPPPEDVDPDGVQGATIVDDSDDESEPVVAQPAVVPAVVPVVAPVVEEQAQVAVAAAEVQEEEVKPKKKIVRKKADA